MTDVGSDMAGNAVTCRDALGMTDVTGFPIIGLNARAHEAFKRENASDPSCVMPLPFQPHALDELLTLNRGPNRSGGIDEPR